MSDNPNKQQENPPLDDESWELVFEAYAGNTDAALNMGYNLVILLSYCVVIQSVHELGIEASFLAN